MIGAYGIARILAFLLLLTWLYYSFPGLCRRIQAARTATGLIVTRVSDFISHGLDIVDEYIARCSYPFTTRSKNNKAYQQDDMDIVRTISRILKDKIHSA